jgi:hypothetical protein
MEVMPENVCSGTQNRDGWLQALSARIVEAKNDQVVKALLAHVAERHRRGGRVLGARVNFKKAELLTNELLKNKMPESLGVLSGVLGALSFLTRECRLGAQREKGFPIGQARVARRENAHQFPS